MVVNKGCKGANPDAFFERVIIGRWGNDKVYWGIQIGYCL
jgi:hypothetical protein